MPMKLNEGCFGMSWHCFRLKYIDIIDAQIAKSPPTSLRHKCPHWTHASHWRHMLDIRPGDGIRID